MPKSCPTLACQAPLSMGSPRQEHWSGLPFPHPGQQNSGRIPHRFSCKHFFLLWEPKHNTDLGGCGGESGLKVRAERAGPRLGVSDERYPSWAFPPGVILLLSSMMINN